MFSTGSLFFILSLTWLEVTLLRSVRLNDLEFGAFLPDLLVIVGLKVVDYLYAVGRLAPPVARGSTSTGGIGAGSAVWASGASYFVWERQESIYPVSIDVQGHRIIQFRDLVLFLLFIVFIDLPVGPFLPTETALLHYILWFVIFL